MQETKKKPRLIRSKEAMDRTGLSRSRLYHLMQNKRFPKNVPLSDGTVGWVESEIDEWIQNRIEKR